MKSTSNNLPFGSEFSPSQIDLPEILGIVRKHSGNCAGLQEAIRRKYFSTHGGGDLKNQKTLAMNCRLGLKAYGIVDESYALTQLGKRLADLGRNPSELYDALATHILLNLNGMNLIQCIRDMNAAGQKITLQTLRNSLEERDIHFPSGGKHPSMMRLWLEKAGVFKGGLWRIDEDRVASLLGTKTDDFAELQGMTGEQKAFLRALANSGESGPQPANRIAQLASATFGIRFPEKSLASQVLVPLRTADYITLTKTTSGRGAKPFMVAATEKLRTEIMGPMLAQLERQADPKVIALLRLSMDVILGDVRSDNRHKSGLALEALAFKLMRLLDMDYKATRLRAQATGGAEVDLVFESTRLVFSRWQIQCKNTPRVSLDDVAKEVGLTHLLKSNVIVVVTTGKIGPEARRYADRIMTESSLCIVMMDGGDLHRIATSPAEIVDVFTREAQHARGIKVLDLAGRGTS